MMRRMVPARCGHSLPTLTSEARHSSRIASAALSEPAVSAVTRTTSASSKVSCMTPRQKISARSRPCALVSTSVPTREVMSAAVSPAPSPHATSTIALWRWNAVCRPRHAATTAATSAEVYGAFGCGFEIETARSGHATS